MACREGLYHICKRGLEDDFIYPVAIMILSRHFGLEKVKRFVEALSPYCATADITSSAVSQLKAY